MGHLTASDDATIIGRFSQVLKLASVSKSVFKSDGNLDFNMGKTEFLARGPTARHVFERTQYFFQTDPDLQVIANDFTPEMFTATGIEVLGTPTGTDTYIKDFVAQNCIKYNFTSPRAILDGAAHSYRYSHRKINTPERYSRFLLRSL
jgi:hypothetical protein